MKKIAIVIIIIVAFGLGASVSKTETVVKEVPKEVTKEVVKEKIVYKTPDACAEAIEIDNEIFSLIADNISSLDFDTITEGVSALQNERVEKANACLLDN